MAVERASALIGATSCELMPFACGVLGVMLANLPVSLSAGLLPPPLLALMPVYFWCLVRPDLMPPWRGLRALVCFRTFCPAARPASGPCPSSPSTLSIERQRDAFAGLVRPGRRSGLRRRRPDRLRLRLSSWSRFYYLAFAACGADRWRCWRSRCCSISRRVLVLGMIHRRLVGRFAERFLMPLFDHKDKSRYATFTAPLAAACAAA